MIGRSPKINRNPLIRHLQRHKGMATIFRQEGETFQTGAASVPDSPLAQAYLWHAPAQDGSDPPVESLAPGASPPGGLSQLPATKPVIAVHRAEKPAAQPLPADPQAATHRAAEIHPPAQGPGFIPAVPPQAAPSKTEPAQTGKETDDATWRRLQTIFQRHQDAGQGLSTPKPAEMPDAVQESPLNPELSTTPTAFPTISSQPEPGAGIDEGSDIPAKPVDKSHSPQPTIPAANAAEALTADSAGTVVSAEDTAVQRAPQSSRSGGPSNTDRQPQPEPAPQPGGQDQPEVIVHAPDSPVMLEKENQAAPDLPENPERDKLPTAEAGTGIAQDEDLLPGWPADRIDDNKAIPGGTIQRLPLEAVWPVQTNRVPAMPEEPPTEGRQVGAPTARQAEKLISALEQVSPGQVSASSIEVVPTRRPRPAPLTAAPSSSMNHIEPPAALADSPLAEPDMFITPRSPDSPENKPFQLDAQAGPAVGNISQHDTHPTEQFHSMAAAQATSAIYPDTSADQLSEEKSAERVQTPDLVPTEIGALPGDLWELIGHPVPGHGKRPVETRGDLKPAQVRERPAEETASNNPPGMVIQRQPEETTSAASTSDSDSSTPSNMEQDSEVDIDRLARSVYAEVRRRLIEEWERMRRRF